LKHRNEEIVERTNGRAKVRAKYGKEGGTTYEEIKLRKEEEITSKGRGKYVRKKGEFRKKVIRRKAR
jgi:hypothetical protein